MKSLRRPPASDPDEQKLRDEWHNARDNLTENPTAEHQEAFSAIDERLSTYLWDRVEAIVKASNPPRTPKPGVHSGKTRHLP